MGWTKHICFHYCRYYNCFHYCRYYNPTHMPTTISRVDLGLFVSISKVALTLDNFFLIKPCAATVVCPIPKTRHSDRYFIITLKRILTFHIVKVTTALMHFTLFIVLKFESTGLLQGLELQLPLLEEGKERIRVSLLPSSQRRVTKQG
jgi:hypothetical protein